MHGWRLLEYRLRTKGKQQGSEWASYTHRDGRTADSRLKLQKMGGYDHTPDGRTAKAKGKATAKGKAKAKGSKKAKASKKRKAEDEASHEDAAESHDEGLPTEASEEA